MSDVPQETPRFGVLLVCTANQCRSPIGEFVLRGALERLGVDWTVRSAGTHARTGGPMTDAAETVLIDAGYDVAGWRSNALSTALIAEADLVLTATAQHRSTVVGAVPAALPRTFPLLQFARLAARVEPIEDPLGPAAGDELLARVRAARSHVQPAAPGGEDIRDPIGRRLRVYRRCLAIVQAAVEQAVTPLLPVADPARSAP